MKTTKEWLDQLAEEYGARNASSVARLLGVSRSSISQNKNGLHSLSMNTALKVADLLGVDPVMVIASSMQETLKNECAKEIWKLAYKSRADRKLPRCTIYKPPTDWNNPN